MSLLPGSKLGAYEILAVLGTGGMGEVYRARDPRLEREVALKVLRQDVTPDGEQLKRFQREARAVAALNHPNIVTIHSVEEAKGTQFFTMELVEGEPLSQMVSAGGLPLKKFFHYAVELTDALTAAHEKGIVHRDLKPANIMVDKRDTVKVLDFGLAKLSGANAPSAETDFTQSQTGIGVMMGTLPYMSPEQLQGKPLDWRSDVFSAGVVFYEMATGCRPFSGTTTIELASSILKDQHKPARELRNDLSSGLEKLLMRCLAKEPSQRYASTRELFDAMEKLHQETLSGSSGHAASSHRASIAVLPFLNMSADRENEFFADGITEEIINVLSQIAELDVVARGSVFSFKGRHVDLRVIGEQLNVRTVLEGSVRKAGNRLRITAELVNVADGYHLWSERFDRELQDVFEIQEEIARAIAGKLKLTLAAGREEPLVRAGTSNLEAYQLYLKGRILLYRRGLGIQRSLECFEKAVKLDPNYALAWAGLADGHAILAFFGFARPQSSLPRSKEAAELAVQLDPSLAEAHNALAGACFFLDWDHPRAGREYQKALELNPRYVPALALSGFWFLGAGEARFDEGIAQVKRAVEIDPLSSYATAILGYTYAMAGRFKEALAPVQTAAALDSESFLAQWCLQNVSRWLGNFEVSIFAAQLALGLSGRSAFALAPLAVTYAQCGRHPEAEALYKELLARALSEYVPSAQLAAPALALGKLEEGMRLIQEAFDMRDPWFKIWAPHNPDYAALRDDPRFVRILAAMKIG